MVVIPGQVSSAAVGETSNTSRPPSAGPNRVLVSALAVIVAVVVACAVIVGVIASSQSNHDSSSTPTTRPASEIQREQHLRDTQSSSDQASEDAKNAAVEADANRKKGAWIQNGQICSQRHVVVGPSGTFNYDEAMAKATACIQAPDPSQDPYINTP